MRLSTEHLVLWPSSLEDVDALHALWRDPAVRKYLWDDRPITRQDAERAVRQSIEAGAQRGLHMWTVETRAGHEFIGFVALREMTLAAEIELYYGLRPEFWGQGLATEAAAALLRYGFEVLGLPRIWARTDEPNLASKRVAERLGMRPADDPDVTSYATYVMAREDFVP